MTDLVFFRGYTHVTHTNIRNAQSCCERLASVDIDRCTVMTSERTILGLYSWNLRKILIPFDFEGGNKIWIDNVLAVKWLTKNIQTAIS